MALLEFLGKFLGRDALKADASKNVAKERLKLVLVHDRASISPEMLQALKEDLIKVISGYMEIDENAIEVSLNSEDDSVALVANIPVLRMKRSLNRQMPVG
jgi:cell division topological specificity factor